MALYEVIVDTGDNDKIIAIGKFPSFIGPENNIYKLAAEYPTGYRRNELEAVNIDINAETCDLQPK